ncbi:MAG: tRNA ((37)-N6)-dimethylallyltransferase MiaA [Bacteroidota bacterium]|jgi:tRNA dimethylallyltransferase
MHQPTCIVIAGPTAVGKTAIAIQLARHFNTAILSFDSRQCYKQLNIGVATPTQYELAQAPHYFIGSHSIHDTVNAAVYEQYALQTVQTIFKTSPVAILVGGTGLYARAFCEGIDALPAINPAVRQQLNEQYATHGLQWLQQQVLLYDAAYYHTAEIQNPRRMLRALEVKLSTGQSILSYQTQQKKQRPFTIVKIGLQLPRPVLYQRINQRVEEMMQQGLLAEVQQLLPCRHLTALQTVGYRELFEYIDGELTLQQAVENIKTNTRHYAKRQITWFSKDADMQWCSPELNEVLSLLPPIPRP